MTIKDSPATRAFLAMLHGTPPAPGYRIYSDEEYERVRSSKAAAEKLACTRSKLVKWAVYVISDRTGYWSSFRNGKRKVICPARRKRKRAK